MGLLSWIFGGTKTAAGTEIVERMALLERTMQGVLQDVETATRASQAAAEAAARAAQAAGEAARAAEAVAQAGTPESIIKHPSERSVIAADNRVNVRLGPSMAGIASVIGKDERLGELSAVQAPWCAICYLKCEFGNGTWVGTGWLINATTVITAGHNLWSPSMKAGEAKHAVGDVQTLTVIPAQDDIANNPKGAIVNPRFVYDKRWKMEGEPARRYYDYGAILLPPPGILLPFYFTPWSATPDEWKTYKTLSCAGFPAEQNGSLLCGDGGPCVDTSTNAMFLGPNQEMVVHDIDTTGGQSGAPVFWSSADKKEFYVLGIHTQGIGLAAGRNACIRITPKMLKTFETWSISPGIQGPQTVA